MFFFHKQLGFVGRYFSNTILTGPSRPSWRTRIERLTHGGEANADGSRFANVLKHLGLAVASDVMGHLEVAKRT